MEDTGKKIVNSTEYEYLVKRIIETNENIGILNAKLKDIETDILSLRGKLNKKLGMIADKSEKTEDLSNSPVYLG